MRRFATGLQVFLAAVAWLAAGRGGWAGTGPGHLGLPRASAYGSSYDNNMLSAMCVDCHGTNPSLHTAESPGVNDTVNFKGSHFVYQSGKATNQTTWEKLDKWGVASDQDSSEGYSKYGNSVSGQTTTGVAGELICESCHNIVLNVRYGGVAGGTPPSGKGNKKLLAWISDTTTAAKLCEGCHPPGDPDFSHGKSHPLTGGLTSKGTVLSTAETSATRSTPLSGSGVTYPAQNALSCATCHRPHDAVTGTGARILRRGYSRATATLGGSVTGVASNGLERQRDIDPGTPPTTSLVTNSAPLCDSCHKYND